MKSAGVFPRVRNEIDFPSDEAEILAFWKAKGIFEKTLDASTRSTGPSKGSFVFYEGPPTANGMPHNGHVLTRAVKDVFPRYKTMQGYDVPRKAGWDTHGLPVEVEVEKELKIHGKAGIEAYGVEPFTHRCIESVFRYTEAWEKLTSKIGFWVDLPSAYVTYHKSYVESVWWALSELFKKGLLYKSHKVVWWWAQGGTALSAAEVGQGYKTVDDPSVFVAFPLVKDPSTALVVWTTTPWTLPSNMYAAVHPDFEYAFVTGDAAKTGGRTLVVAAKLVESVAKKLGTELTVVRTVLGKDLVGERYIPPFDTYVEEAKAHDVIHSVVAANFVLLDASGIVHIAPAFGEDDSVVHRDLQKTRHDLPLFCAIGPDGLFTDVLPKYAGRWVKDCDRELTRDLAERSLLLHTEVYRHEYPFCWRSDQDPLIQYARPAWYIRTTSKNAEAIANNQAVNWLPDHIKEGRFGDFLRNNVDWALSRERYWGTPLNIWVNDVTGAMEAPASVDEILAKNPKAFEAFEAAREKNPALSTHLLVHKPWVDLATWENPGEPGVYRRVSDVIDCWFDSGCMPFAQWGYPHAPASQQLFEKAFPADFISEAIDQTRGWFYSLLMISTLVFDEETQKKMGLAKVRSFPHPYKTCVVLGHVGDREGKKESKSKGNYTPPDVILERVGMEFAVARAEDAALSGGNTIAREDYEGLDLQGDAAELTISRKKGEATLSVKVKVKPSAKSNALPRRVVFLDPEAMRSLELDPVNDYKSVKLADVAGLSASSRVWIEDPSAPAPGADAFRWFFYASSPSWTNTRHSLTAVRNEQKEFLLKLRNVFSFFTIYANIDGFDPARGATSLAELEKVAGYRPVEARSLLDRWVSSELWLTVEKVTTALDGYLLYDAAQSLVDLVESLSNWYVRRSRARFWAAGSFADGTASQDKSDAYFTLYEALVTIAKLAAPFVPFIAEGMWQTLVTAPFAAEVESVHLMKFPEPKPELVLAELSKEMRGVREVVSLGLSVRTTSKLKVRQPLAYVDVVVSDRALLTGLRSHQQLIAEELNVHEVRFLAPGEEKGLVTYVLKPNFRALGPKLGKKVQIAKSVLAKADAALLRVEMADKGAVTLDLEGEAISVGPEEIQVGVEAKDGFAAAGGRVGVVILNTVLTDALRDEGLAREIQARVQQLRKDKGLEISDRISLRVGGSERVIRVIRENQALIARECSADELSFDAPPDAVPTLLEGESLLLGLEKR